MITVGMNYTVLPGKGERFETAFDGVRNAMERDPGHRESHLYRDVTSPESYLIVSEWDDEKAFQTFVSSEAFARVVDWGKEEILAGRPQHKIYREDTAQVS